MDRIFYIKFLFFVIFLFILVKRVNSSNNFLTNNNNNSNNNLIIKNDVNKMTRNQQNIPAHRKLSRSFSTTESFAANTNRTSLFSIIPSKTFRYLERLMSEGN
jgi:hypothetical protein